MRVVIFSHSRVSRDPRVLRQITWLRSLGFNDIATVGLGPQAENTSNHHEMPRTGLAGRIYGYLMPMRRQRFKHLYGQHLNKLNPSVLKDVDLIVLNEVEYAGWPQLQDLVTNGTPIYLDLHEDHTGHSDRNLLERVIFRRYNNWAFENIKKLVSLSERIGISTVSGSIANQYRTIFDKPVVVVHNAPAANTEQPNFTEANLVRLVHHGMGSAGKGIETCVRSLKYLEDRFTLTLILFASPFYKAKVRFIAALNGQSTRLSIIPGVPLDRLPRLLNAFDLEVMPFSNKTSGFRNALPNKLFEAIQAKVGIVTGPNYEMKNLVETWGVGVSASGRRPIDLAKVLNGLDTDTINHFKQNTLRAAEYFNEDLGCNTFRSIIGKLLSS